MLYIINSHFIIPSVSSTSYESTVWEAKIELSHQVRMNLRQAPFDEIGVLGSWWSGYPAKG